MKFTSETVVIAQCGTCPNTAGISFKTVPWAVSRPMVIAAFVSQGWTQAGRCPECKGKRKSGQQEERKQGNRDT